MGRWIDKVVTYGREEREGISTKKGKETHTLFSLRSWRFSGRCCTFLAAEPREDWGQVKEGFSPFSLAVSPLALSGSFSPRKYPRRRLHSPSRHSMSFFKKEPGIANEMQL